MDKSDHITENNLSHVSVEVKNSENRCCSKGCKSTFCKWVPLISCLSGVIIIISCLIALAAQDLNLETEGLKHPMTLLTAQ